MLRFYAVKYCVLQCRLFKNFCHFENYFVSVFDFFNCSFCIYHHAHANWSLLKS